MKLKNVFSFIPAKAGMQENKRFWTPAFAGVAPFLVSSDTV
jgi:hypothetical protein